MMKKSYVKPLIGFQSFAMPLSVSSGCTFLSTSGEMVCAIEMEEWGGATIFTEEIDCMLTTPQWTDRVCYHVPLANSNVFES